MGTTGCQVTYEHQAALAEGAFQEPACTICRVDVWAVHERIQDYVPEMDLSHTLSKYLFLLSSLQSRLMRSVVQSAFAMM